jgi:hypothetical protein
LARVRSAVRVSRTLVSLTTNREIYPLYYRAVVVR